MGVLKQNDIWVLAPWLGTKNIIRGKVVASLILGRGESCGFVFVRDLSVHQKCSNYTLTNLLFNLCRYVWIIELLVTFLSFHLGTPTCHFTSKVLRDRKRAPTPYPFVLFTLYSHLSLLKSLGVCQ